MKIVWDNKKAESNFRKHRVSFDEAASCLLDPMALVDEDPDAEGEQRFIMIGMTTTSASLLSVMPCRTKKLFELYRPENQRPERRPVMRKEYDFSNATRAKDVPHLAKLQSESTKGKTRITTYLDNDIVEWLKARGESENKGYQTVLNELLRKQLTPEKSIAEVLRQVVREELKNAA